MIGRAQLSEVEGHLENHAGEEAEIRRVVDEIDNLCDEKKWKKLRSLFDDELESPISSLGTRCAIVSKCL